MSQATLDSRPIDRAPATVAPSVRAGWAALQSVLARWFSRRRLGASLAHLDDRLLADAGFGPSDLGLGERLIRRFVAGGDIWPRDSAGR
jgi:uncharacterized protein YjiS (DUF1127 family)